MNHQTKNNQKLTTPITVTICAALFILLGYGAYYVLSQPNVHIDRSGLTATTSTDHPVYAGAQSVYDDAGLVVLATATGESSPITDERSAQVRTSFTFSVESIVKGSYAEPGIQIATPEGYDRDGVSVEFEGGATINKGTTYLLFLPKQHDKANAFYPIAGFKAIAEQQTDGSFLFPEDVVADGAREQRQFKLEDLR